MKIVKVLMLICIVPVLGQQMQAKIAAEVRDNIIQLRSDMINGFRAQNKVTDSLISAMKNMTSEIGKMKMETAQIFSEKISQLQVASSAGIASLDNKMEYLIRETSNTSVASTAAMTTLKNKIGLIAKKVNNSSDVSSNAFAALKTRLDEHYHSLEKHINSSSETTRAVMKDAAGMAVQDIKSHINKNTDLTILCELSAVELRLQSSCSAIHTRLPDAASGVYTIYPAGRAPGRSVWCDMVTDGGGWTRVQHRQDGSVAFNRNWEAYQEGFGFPHGEFWFGNDDLHRLTAAQPSELRVELWDWDGRHGYAKYSTFSVGSASDNYRLHVGGYTGTIGNSLAGHNSRQFTTTDRDNDGRSWENCATTHGEGGWWYVKCYSTNLNGRYYTGGVETIKGVAWFYWRRNYYSYKAAAMLIRDRQ